MKRQPTELELRVFKERLGGMAYKSIMQMFPLDIRNESQARAMYRNTMEYLVRHDKTVHGRLWLAACRMLGK